VCVAVTPAMLKEGSRSIQNLFEGCGSIQIQCANSIDCAN
jgi:hypothetical protein